MRSSSTLFTKRPIGRIWTKSILVLLVSFAGSLRESSARATQVDQNPPANLKQLSLEQLGAVEVTTACKQPEQGCGRPAAIYVITQEDIRRSGATSIPEVLRLAPGLEVARTDSDHWAVGSRGVGGPVSQSRLGQ